MVPRGRPHPYTFVAAEWCAMVADALHSSILTGYEVQIEYRGLLVRSEIGDRSGGAVGGDVGNGTCAGPAVDAEAVLFDSVFWDGATSGGNGDGGSDGKGSNSSGSRRSSTLIAMGGKGGVPHRCMLETQRHANGVIRGWADGIRTMKRDETARFAIAPEKAYGATGIDSVVPPNTTVSLNRHSNAMTSSDTRTEAETESIERPLWRTKQSISGLLQILGGTFKA